MTDNGRLTSDDYVNLYQFLAFNVVKAKTDTKRPVGKWKHLRDELPDEREWQLIRNHAARGKPLFLMTGDASKVIVLDLDTPEAATLWRDRLGDAWDTIPRVRTPSGGYHLYFSVYDDTAVRSISKYRPSEGWELKADRTGVSLPVGTADRVWEIMPEDDMPDYRLLLEPHIQSYASSHTNGKADWNKLDIQAIFEGVPLHQRDNTAYQYACSLRARNVHMAEARVLMRGAWELMQQDEKDYFPWEDASQKIDNVWKDKPAGKSEAFVKQSRDDRGFTDRVIDRRVDLITLIDEGIPPREYHACSDGMLAVPSRNSIAAPKKTGKSLASLCHFVRMALEDEVILILDRENGQDEYARRLEEIMTAWDLSHDDRDTIQQNLIYHAFPTLRPDDTTEFVNYCLDLDATVVLFDSQRRFLTDFNLKESDADDYARFMESAIDPLFRSGITTIILDNTPHSDDTRSRGSATKGDLVDTVFHIETLQPFDKDTRGAIKLVQDDSRFGDRHIWRMEIGGGHFGKWIKDSTAKVSVRDDVFATVSTLAKLIADTDKLPNTRELTRALPFDQNRRSGAIAESERRGYIKRVRDGSAIRHDMTQDGYNFIDDAVSEERV
jgi:hypothetical protein